MDDKFYQLVKNPGNEETAASVAINVSVSRNPTYSKNISASDKRYIREYWKSLLTDFYEKHKQGNVSKKEFFSYVDYIKQSMNSKFPDKFKCNTKGYDKMFRLAHAQKSLSVFLKHLWCMGKMKEPPFCPIDGIILHDVLKKEGIWTKLNDDETYKQYIDYVVNAANNSNMSVAEWEYNNWNKAVEARNNYRKVGEKQNKKNNEKKSAKPFSSTKSKRQSPSDSILPEKNRKKGDMMLEWKWVTLNGEPFLLFAAERPNECFFCQLCYKYEDDVVKRNHFDINALSDVQMILKKFSKTSWYPRTSKAWKTYKYVKFSGNNAKSDTITLYNDILSFIEKQ